jgi:hypothetical protein
MGGGLGLGIRDAKPCHSADRRTGFFSWPKDAGRGEPQLRIDCWSDEAGALRESGVRLRRTVAAVVSSKTD